MSADSLMAREALDLRLRLELGFANPDEVELWADAWLLALEIPPDVLTDLAFAKRMTPTERRTALVALGGDDKDVDPIDLLRVVANADVTDWSYERLDRLMQSLAEWSDDFIFQRKDGVKGWSVVDKAYFFEGPPSDPPPQKDQERLRVVMLEVLEAARQFVAAESQAGSPA